MVFGPSEITVEKLTPLQRAQSRMLAVSAPDWHTSASGPGAASGPAALALSLRCGRWKPRLLGPSSCTPWRRAIAWSSLHWAPDNPAESTSPARQRMRPATSIAAAICSGGSAMTARSARASARSASVPDMPMSRKVSWPSKGWALIDDNSDCAIGVRAGSSSGSCGSPANTTIDWGANSGVR